MYEKLKKLRVEMNVPVSELCELLNLKKIADYYKKESGKIRFSLEEGKKIADRLGKSIEEVFFDDELSEMEQEEVS
jgi:putative transcriptional regulator